MTNKEKTIEQIASVLMNIGDDEVKNPSELCMAYAKIVYDICVNNRCVLKSINGEVQSLMGAESSPYLQPVINKNIKEDKRYVILKFNKKPTKKISSALKVIFSKYSGNYNVYLLVQDGKKWSKMKTSFKINYNFRVKRLIEDIVGVDCVKLS